MNKPIRAGEFYDAARGPVLIKDFKSFTTAVYEYKVEYHNAAGKIEKSIRKPITTLDNYYKVQFYKEFVLYE